MARRMKVQDDTTVHFARTLRRLRLAAGLSLGQLGRASGLGQPLVGRYESGERIPTLPAAIRLARALGVSLSVFDPSPSSPRPDAS